ncbi:MAG: hypothetical protein UT02_C0017G0001, partial [Parcubacteria group bacterium GW2011_GWC2_38_7]
MFVRRDRSRPVPAIKKLPFALRLGAVVRSVLLALVQADGLQVVGVERTVIVESGRVVVVRIVHFCQTESSEGFFLERLRRGFGRAQLLIERIHFVLVGRVFVEAVPEAFVDRGVLRVDGGRVFGVFLFPLGVEVGVVIGFTISVPLALLRVCFLARGAEAGRIGANPGHEDLFVHRVDTVEVEQDQAGALLVEELQRALCVNRILECERQLGQAVGHE